jgi:hypothetical protein
MPPDRKLGGGQYGLVAVLRSGAVRFLSRPPGLPKIVPGGRMGVDTEGRLLLPLDDGLAIQEEGGFRKVGRPAGLRGPVYSVLQDREGSVWIGLVGHGLAQWFGYREWEAYTADSGLETDVVYGALPYAGSVWVGAEAGLFRGKKTAAGWVWQKQTRVGTVPVWIGLVGHGLATLPWAPGSMRSKWTTWPR